MPMKYKVDVIAALKEAGYNTGTIRKEKIMGEAMLQRSEAVRWCPGQPWKRSANC